MKRIVILMILTVFLVGCSPQTMQEYPLPEGNEEAQVVIPEDEIIIDPFETVEVTEVVDDEEWNAAELDAADIAQGECPHPQGGDCRTDMPVCGSDERTYENRCTACDNPTVEWWVEGIC